jgi:hypothetical protein
MADDFCDKKLEMGKKKFEAKNYEDAKTHFKHGLEGNCNNVDFQNWIDRCNEEIKKSKTPKSAPKPSDPPQQLSEPPEQKTVDPITSVSAVNNEKTVTVRTAPLDISECLLMMNKAINASPTSSWDSGNRYKGQKNNGGRNGLGVFYYNTGDYYFGEFKNGDRDGTGIYIKQSDGYCKYYAGEWSSNKKSGKGACYDNMGTLNYYGDFVNGDLANTHSTAHDAYKFEVINGSTGEKYIGETKNGKSDGYGIFLWSNGDMWYGQWKDNKRAGYGIVINNNGDVIAGTWDGDTYKGNGQRVLSVGTVTEHNP